MTEATDPAPKNLSIGAINPYALTEAITGKTIDWTKPGSAKIVSDTLETDYNELFDMKFHSPIYAGLKVGANNMAEQLKPSELKILTDEDRVTPSLGDIKRVGDLKKVGVDNIEKAEVRNAFVNNGKLSLVVDAPALNKKFTNSAITKGFRDTATPFRSGSGKPPADWTPPNSSWRDTGDFFKDVTEYNDPIQGAVGNCYLIAAIAAVAWADPYAIVHRNRATGVGEADRMNAIQFYSKGGVHDAPTATVEVTDKTIINNVTLRPIYCRSNDASEIWPALYEKAFAKWITKASSDSPDITQTAYGDPAKATAQLNDKTAYYYSTANRSADRLYTVVRENSVSFKTINPMTAWTHPTGDYAGSNIVANHAYTVLGWAFQGGRPYIVLRNPWGITEPSGLSTYQGLLSFFDHSFWHPINTIGDDGVFALEAEAFKFYFAYLGVAK